MAIGSSVVPRVLVVCFAAAYQSGAGGAARCSECLVLVLVCSDDFSSDDLRQLSCTSIVPRVQPRI